MLRAAGSALVANDLVEHADIIVVALATDAPGVLEADDLVHTALASRVAVFVDFPDPVVAREFARRGIPYEDDAGQSIRQVNELGVENTERIPRYVAGSEDEGPVLADWCDRHAFGSVVVTTSDHSQHLRRVLHRAMKGHKTKVMVRPASYSQFDANRWWKTRFGLRNLKSYGSTTCVIPFHRRTQPKGKDSHCSKGAGLMQPEALRVRNEL